MMDWAPIVRIFIRYCVGAAIGIDNAARFADDSDIITIIALAVGVIVEGFYALAIKRGWAR